MDKSLHSTSRFALASLLPLLLLVLYPRSGWSSGEGIIIPGYRVGALLAKEDFSEGLGDWKTEGKIAAKIKQGALVVESQGDGEKNPKGNIWWNKRFESPYMIRFDYRSLSRQGLTMVFWNAWGVNGKNLFSWQRSGKYTEYISGNLQAYHLSFHRFGSGQSNIRKAPGFHLISTAPDPVLPGDHAWHRFAIAVTGDRQSVFVDGKRLHDVIDHGEPCLNTNPWEHDLPCLGTGPTLTHGMFGIRVTQRQRALFDRIRVYRLVATEKNGARPTP